MPPSLAHQPVATAVIRRGHADDRLVEGLATHRAVELGIAKAKMPPSLATVQ